jgi:hypothetical protein
MPLAFSLSMDHGLMTRALIIGFVCFLLAIGGYYYLSLMDDQASHEYREITDTESNNSDGIGAIGLLMLVTIGFLVLMIVAGAITALVSAQYRERWQDIFAASALAGSTPIVLFWIVFWCLTIANVISGVLDQETFGFGDLVFLGYFAMISVLTIGVGGLIAGLSGHVIRAIAVISLRSV